MKFSFAFVALIAAVSALPIQRRHNDHNHNSITSKSVTAPAAAAATPANSVANGGKQHQHQHQHESNPTPNTAANPAASPVAAATAVKSPAPAAPTASNAPAAPTPAVPSSGSGPVTDALVPAFGQQAGLSPNGSGSCKADSGKLIPCQCPPSREAFIAKANEFAAAGVFPGGTLKADFPLGSTPQVALAQIDFLISALQNFNGSPGSGCPAVSAPNFSVVQSNLIKAGA